MISITFLSLWNGYGAGKMYDPTAPQQRRDKQHSVDARKEMLLSYIGGEDLGKFILQEKSNGQFWIIDGRQRSSLVNEFLTDKMTLNGVYAQNFWKWFFTDNFLLDSNPLEPKDRIKVNKILKTFEKGTTPTVKFSDLPTSIQTNQQLWISKLQSNPIVETITLSSTTNEICPPLKGPNFSLSKQT
jgi:hypothetical protein